MDAISKMSLIELSRHFAYLQNSELCWQRLEHLILQQCKENFVQARQSAQEVDAMSVWWQTCFELLSAHQIQICHVNYREEYIELFNRGPAIVDLHGWKLCAGDQGQSLVFPRRTLMHPQEKLTITTSEHDSTLNFASARPIWNNRGDSATLLDASWAEICCWKYGVAAHCEVAISQVHYDRAQHDEYVEIANLGSAWVDLSGWSVVGDKSQQFEFPSGAVLRPQGMVRVYTSLCHPQTGGFSFNSKQALWMREGGEACLLDYQSRLVSKFSW
ncbi:MULTISPECIES: lamin tail domain-containing protein [Pseudoalteromonas]|uniref:lamin tail domain-containing protein n=1 Tax=Pseudoalteromonas TaxID=53246 RepID=UPI000F79802D|nr:MULTISPECIES: lamin tail domain-containing protein [Pseudoalteromonas]MCG7563049.1 lamin tail domain-containing protein [Pseudoalteromonas sp. McH1-42]MEC4091659.1 lamin tail domain-containing protein [Pseudoalteromonas rubra]